MDFIADDLTIYDAIIVGEGAAALDAALMLGRCRDRVLFLDDNLAAEMSHEADVETAAWSSRSADARSSSCDRTM